MIRFRVGHSWKREPLGPDGPRDAFALELEGVNVLPGANDEPLVRIVTALVDAVASLVADGERAGQVSLEDVHLELCFWKATSREVTVRVIDLSQPPREVRAPIAIELSALVGASVQCARTFLRDVQPHRASVEAELVVLEKRLKRLTGAVIHERPLREGTPWNAVRAPQGGLGFTLRDPEGRTLAWNRKTRAGLPPLLIDGELTHENGTQLKGLPFLSMLGLVRSAAAGEARIGKQAISAEQVYLAALELCLALRAHNPALGANPYVDALQVRCSDGLIAMRRPVPDTTIATVSPPRSTPSVPLSLVGEVRRVALQPRWSRPVVLGEEGARILLGKRWIIVHSRHAAQAFTKVGATAFRHLAAQGLAVSADGDAVCATGDRLLFFAGRARSAQWMKDASGDGVGPTLDSMNGVLVCPYSRRGVMGLAKLTGREMWRFEPPRTQTIFFSRMGTRVLVATDGGTVFGLDLHDGQVRFRIQAGLPVVRAPVAVRNRTLVVLNRGEHSAVYLCDALSAHDTKPAGALVWTRELILSTPSAPVWAKGHTWLTGGRDGRTVLVCLGNRGQVLWEKNIACDARTASLLAWEGGVLVADARGAATRVLPDGSAEWVLGSPGDELSRPIPLCIRRNTLVVPGPVTRLVQPRGGRVLTELATGPRMLDLAVDKNLTIYVLREPGTLETYVPGTALALVPSAR